jgi:hypothetical protein
MGNCVHIAGRRQRRRSAPPAFQHLPPPVHIEQIIADRKPYDATPATKHLRLPPLIRDLEIDYTALSLVVPEKNRFRIKLEGFDGDWQDVNNRRQAYYTNLPPGNYRFRAIASNNSGVWNETGAVLDFAIAPAYYQTAWFRRWPSSCFCRCCGRAPRSSADRRAARSRD